LVLGEKNVQFGIVADAVEEVNILRIDEILDPPGSVAGVSREYVLGVTSDALVVLDGKVLMKDERLYIDESDV
jgi:chemotaxis signal transduction protein